MFYNFFLQYLRHSDVTKWDTVFSHESKSLYVVVLCTPTRNVFLLFVASKWLENVNRSTKMKIDLIWTSILREIDDDMISVCREKYIAYINIILEICAYLATKIRCKHKCMYLAKLLKQVSSLVVGVFGC